MYTQPAPTAFAHVGWKYYLVFILVPICGVPILYFFPETKGLTLEEVGALFGDNTATVDEFSASETNTENDKGKVHYQANLPVDSEG